MTTIKSYTNLEQSKKLAEILPSESAGMWWSRCIITDFGDGVLKVSYAVEPCNISQFRNTKEDIPCWSLATLLDTLSKSIYFINEAGIVELSSIKATKWCVSILNCGKIESCYADNPVDACYEMILKLHELKML